MTDKESLLDSYNKSFVSYNTLKKYSLDLSDINKSLNTYLDSYYINPLINKRKVYYEDKEIDTMNHYQSIILVIYYLLLAYYILFGNFRKNKEYINWKVWVAIILYVSIPLYLKNIIYNVIELPNIIKNSQII